MKLKTVMTAIQNYLVALDEPQGTTDAEALGIETEVQSNGATEHTIKIVVRVTPPGVKPDPTVPPYLREKNA